MSHIYSITCFQMAHTEKEKENTEPFNPLEQVAGHHTGAQSALSSVDGAQQRPGTEQTPETQML